MRKRILLALACWIGGVFLRWTGPDDLMAWDQERAAVQALELAQNRHFWVQEDLDGNPRLHPPLHAASAALAGALRGGLDRWALSFPSIAATGLTCLLLLAWGGKTFGPWAGFWAVPLYLFSDLGLRQIGLVRGDVLFQLLVFAAAFAAFRAWHSGRSWIWFYLPAAAAALAQSPWGLVLAGSGLLAAWWEHRDGTPLPLRGGHRRGLLLFLALPLAWLLLAWGVAGDAVLRSLFDTGPAGAAWEILLPGWYLATRMFPACLPALAALWRVYRHPDPLPERRRLERFLACAFWVGLAAAGLGARPTSTDLIPLLPFAALLGGREVARRLASRDEVENFRFALAACGLALLLSALGLHVPKRHAGSRDTRDFARALTEPTGPFFPWIYVEAPAALRVHLGVLAEENTIESAAPLFDPEWPAFFVLKDPVSFAEAVRDLGTNEVGVLDLGPAGAALHAVSPHDRLAWPAQWQWRVRGTRVFARNLILESRRGRHWRFRAAGGDWTLQFSHDLDADRWADSPFPRLVTVRTDHGRSRFQPDAMETLSGHSESVPPASAWRGRWGGLALALLGLGGMAWGSQRAARYADQRLP